VSHTFGTQSPIKNNSCISNAIQFHSTEVTDEIHSVKNILKTSPCSKCNTNRLSIMKAEINLLCKTH